ncbi:FCD domain-containing protein [Martelella alba]|uniref:GntR family transcriptional regulator n=1 Tax=Martelella alba TaxID=2590451 RepID=A0ABY2SNC6_9HYPH|nr:FCD domain-containing protein [Martelella alba]TKI05943.1 GntR family transcriptional regulator [Martelella alba]
MGVILQEKKQYQEIGRDIRQKIQAGHYPVNSRLPPERNIAESYGVSRTIIREALLMLELEGVVDIRQGSGVYVVRPPGNEAQEDAGYDDSDVGPFELLQARQLLESNIAAFAAKMATKMDIENMRRSLEQEQRDIVTNERSVANDKLFHELIAGATQNQMLLDTVRSIWSRQESSALWQGLYSHIETRSLRLRWLADHQNILVALRRRDVMGSYQCMWQHMENMKNTLMEISDADAPEFDGYLFESVPIFQGKLV